MFLPLIERVSIIFKSRSDEMPRQNRQTGRMTGALKVVARRIPANTAFFLGAR